MLASALVDPIYSLTTARHRESRLRLRNSEEARNAITANMDLANIPPPFGIEVLTRLADSSARFAPARKL
jgi:hypothetical protein